LKYVVVLSKERGIQKTTRHIGTEAERQETRASEPDFYVIEVFK